MLVTYLIIWGLLVVLTAWAIKEANLRRVYVLYSMVILAMWPLIVAVPIVDLTIKYTMSLFKVLNKLLTKLFKRGK